VGNFETDISMEGSVLLCKNNDQPGIIGRVGTLLASHDINISFMSVGRTGPRQSAVMALGLDDHLPEAVMHGLQEIPMIEELVFLDLAPRRRLNKLLSRSTASEATAWLLLCGCAVLSQVPCHPQCTELCWLLNSSVLLELGFMGTPVLVTGES